MDVLQFLRQRISEREQFWQQAAVDDPAMTEIVDRHLALCAEDRRRLAKADFSRTSRPVLHMMLAYRDHPDFESDWLPDL